jgi:histidinol dehydrogenase
MFELVKIDDQFLTDLGLAHLTDEEKQEVAEKIRTALESKVGIKLAHSLNEDQLNEFNGIIGGDDPKAAMDWMEKNMPNYRDVVMDELDAIIDQIKHNNLSFIKRL